MNRTEFVESVVADQLKPKDTFPEFSVGDTIDVHYLIVATRHTSQLRSLSVLTLAWMTKSTKLR